MWKYFILFVFIFFTFLFFTLLCFSLLGIVILCMCIYFLCMCIFGIEFLWTETVWATFFIKIYFSSRFKTYTQTLTQFLFVFVLFGLLFFALLFLALLSIKSHAIHMPSHYGRIRFAYSPHLPRILSACVPHKLRIYFSDNPCILH